MHVIFEFKFPKAKATLLYLASRDLPEFTKGKACKLMFLADKLHLVQYGRPITGDNYAAMQHGPIPSHMLNILNAVESNSASNLEERELATAIKLDCRFMYPRIHAVEPASIEHLSESDIDAIDHVVREYGRKSFTVLRSLTHDMPAYERAWAARNGDSAPMLSFENFFEEDEDALAGVFEEMIENEQLKAVFPEPAWL